MNYLHELVSILNAMSPYLLLGFLISGILHVYVPKSFYSKFFKRKGLRSVVSAALVGIPIPLCSCGVIPTAISFKREGASDGATISFLVATPQTGVDSILATYSLLGLPFAIFRPIAALFMAVFGGLLVDKFGEKKQKQKPTVNYSQLRFSTPYKGCGCGCNGEKKVEEKSPSKIVAVLQYGFVKMMGSFGKWLVVGLFLAAAITAFVPDSFFTIFREHYVLNILLILLISAPMYICAVGSIPIALSLILKGLSPGAAFVMLMAGPATNIASLIILKKEIGLRKTAIYLVSIILGAIVSAAIIDFVLPHEWFSSITAIGNVADVDGCNHSMPWWNISISVLFVLLFINSQIKKGRKTK